MAVVALISGRGSNLRALVEAGLPVAAVISNVAGAQGLEFARERGIATRVVEHRRFPSRDAFDAALAREIDAFQPTLVALAGFMRVLGADLVRRYERRLLNIHPALLPAFGGKGMYGHRVHEAVLAYGAKVSGCTVHFADDTYDTGPIVVQKCVAVKEGDDPDTLAARVFQAECEAYPEAIELIAAGRVTVQGRRVVISG